MEAKKNPRADVQRRYGLHLSIGFMVALALVVTAFEWRTAYEPPITVAEIAAQVIEVVDVPLTKVPDPPKPKVVMPEIKEVDNEIDVPEVELIIDPVEVEEIDLSELMPEPIDEVAPEFVDYAEVMPDPVGGMADFMAFLGKNIRYPK
ncbi:MAG: energy transducer TonB, partial [Imperialibacter sp.]